jgi:hypothetical protein
MQASIPSLLVVSSTMRSFGWLNDMSNSMLRHVSIQSKDVSNMGRVSKMDLCAEGDFNRVYLLTMDDGFEVIVKIPYSIALPKYYATATEVATLAFLRSKGIPVPQVYGWSSRSSVNDISVECIIMERASRIRLDTRWFNMTK